MLSDQSPLPDFHRLSLSPYRCHYHQSCFRLCLFIFFPSSEADHRELRVTDRRFDATDLHRALRLSPGWKYISKMQKLFLPLTQA
ncbi:hypothetical protein K1719_020541 [Acacia pycnantha]|nr:hypothetical protein K1719_020541 [Acacia pycnantha]